MQSTDSGAMERRPTDLGIGDLSHLDARMLDRARGPQDPRSPQHRRSPGPTEPRGAEPTTDPLAAVRRPLSVLVLGRDPEDAELTGDNLNEGPYRITLTTSDAVAVAAMRETPFDIVIMEVSDRPTDEVVELVRRLTRHRPHLGLIFLSHSRVSIVEAKALYDAGADDYVEKPYHPGLFVMRVANVARRVRLHMAAQIDGGLAGLELDVREGVARFGGQDLNLTTTEFLMLHELCLVEGAVVSYSRLNARLLGSMSDEDGSTLRTHVSGLRRKLEAAGVDPEVISTERGAGYALRVLEG